MGIDRLSLLTGDGVKEESVMPLINCVQGDNQWFAERCGRVTASRMNDVLAVLKKGGESAARAKYKLELLAEICTGHVEEHFVTEAMARGAEQEPFARAAYEVHAGVMVDQVGFFVHPRIDRAGASPDGLIGHDGLIEIKAPQTTTHLQYLIDGVVPVEYQAQMLWQMACTGREWCDFVSFDQRLPEHLQLFVVRFERDEKRIAELETAVGEFLRELDALMLRLPAPGGETGFARALKESLLIAGQETSS